MVGRSAGDRPFLKIGIDIDRSMISLQVARKVDDHPFVGEIRDFKTPAESSIPINQKGRGFMVRKGNIPRIVTVVGGISANGL
jgi:flagellar basal body rod protein FlgF